jgi:DNA helicase HerA-like ATPase
MRPNPNIGDISAAITELAVGEALVSFLDAKGRPSVTERVYVLPPGSQIGPITPEQRQALLQISLVAGVYEQTIDRESAYEKLKGRAAPATGQPNGHVGSRASSPTRQAGAAGQAGISGSVGAAGPGDAGGGLMGGLKDVLFGSTGPRGGRHEGLAQKAAASAMRTIGSAVGREIVRGVLGSLLGGSRRR